MSWSKLWETVKGREGWRVAVHGVTESDTTERQGRFMFPLLISRPGPGDCKARADAPSSQPTLCRLSQLDPRGGPKAPTFTGLLSFFSNVAKTCESKFCVWSKQDL